MHGVCERSLSQTLPARHTGIRDPGERVTAVPKRQFCRVFHISNKFRLIYSQIEEHAQIGSVWQAPAATVQSLARGGYLGVKQQDVFAVAICGE